MEVLLEEFSFQTTLLESSTDIDELLEEYSLEIDTLAARVQNRSVDEKRTANRAVSLVDSIQEYEAKVAAKIIERDSFATTSKDYEEADIELDKLKARLRELKFQRSEKLPPSVEVEKAVSLGKALALLSFYSKLQTALEERKAALSFSNS